MKKIIFISVILVNFLIIPMSFCQSNDEKVIDFLDIRLKTMFKILNNKPQTISSTCIDSLKKLHDFKEKLKINTNASDNQKEIDISILRALYSNSIQFCETDVQAICSKRTDPIIRKTCKDITEQNN